MISGLPIRPIGPAVMGGRIADIAAVREGEKLTIYIGSASGGVWRSRDGGTTFKPIFDQQPGLSIGSITIDPSDSKTVWVGTGESWVRNSVSVGTGVYRSHDAGENWDAVGLPDSEHVSRILISPKTARRFTHAHLGISGIPTASAASTKRAMAARRGQRFSTAMTAQAAPKWRWTRRIRASSTRPCGTFGASPGTSAPVVRAAASSSRRTLARPGTSCAKACPKAISAASEWRLRPAIIIACRHCQAPQSHRSVPL